MRMAVMHSAGLTLDFQSPLTTKKCQLGSITGDFLFSTADNT